MEKTLAEILALVLGTEFGKSSENFSKLSKLFTEIFKLRHRCEIPVGDVLFSANIYLQLKQFRSSKITCANSQSSKKL